MSKLSRLQNCTVRYCHDLTTCSGPVGRMKGTPNQSLGQRGGPQRRSSRSSNDEPTYTKRLEGNPGDGLKFQASRTRGSRGRVQRRIVIRAKAG